MLYGKTREECLALLAEWRQAIAETSLYGYGLSRRLYTSTLMPPEHDLNLKGIFDGNPALHGLTVLGYPILDPASVGEVKGKIIVFPGEPAYSGIRGRLESAGLREFYDFVSVDLFWALLAHYKYGQLHDPYILTAFVTSRCTLRCRRCADEKPLWPSPFDASLGDLKADLEGFFSHVDMLRQLNITGGEPLLYEGLVEYVNFLGGFRHKIGAVTLVSNGTVLPEQRHSRALLEQKVMLILNDYRKVGLPGYDEKFELVVQKFRRDGIEPVIIPGQQKNSPNIWPEAAAKLEAFNGEALKGHYAACRAVCHAYSNDLFYTCNRARVNSLKTGVRESGAANWENSGRTEILMSLLGYVEFGALSFCKKCPGKTFAEAVQAAEQLA